jgi:hypothetical protein
MDLTYSVKTVSDYKQDTDFGSLNDAYAYNSYWNCSSQYGLYPVNVSDSPILTTVKGVKNAADVKIGKIQYNDNNHTMYNNFKFGNLVNNETDIMFMHDGTYFFKHTYYHLVFYEGLPYLITTDSVGVVYWTSYEYLLSYEQVPSGIVDIKYTYNFDTGIFELFVDGISKGSISLPDITELDNYAISGNQVEIVTDNCVIGQPENSLNILSDGQQHTVERGTNPNDLTSQLNIFFMVMFWTLPDLPWWLNIILVKLWLIIFVIILLMILYSIATSWYT